MDRRQLLAGIAASTALTAAGPAGAQAFPNKPIRLVVPFAPGGTTDIIARVVGAAVQPHLGQGMVIENRAGAAGAIGAAEVARAAPDGYVLGMATVSTTATVPAIQPGTPYNPVTDFTPIINIAATPNVIAVHPGFPAKDYAGFVAELKKNPTKYSYGSSGTGSINHLLMELFKIEAGVEATHVPYRGSGPALNDAVAGQIQIVYDNLPSALPFIKGGRLVAIAVTGPQRASVLPDIPTLGQLGMTTANRMAYYGVYGPKNLPKDIVGAVHAAVMKTLADADVRKKIDETGSLVVGNTPEQFAAEIKAEFEIYKKVVTEKQLKPE